MNIIIIRYVRSDKLGGGMMNGVNQMHDSATSVGNPPLYWRATPLTSSLMINSSIRY